MEFVERNIAGTVVYAMDYARVVALLGPRQAGKSTLARKLAAEQLSAGLLGALVGADISRVREDDSFAGSLFETFVAAELERQASWFEQPVTFWHYREAGREVDVILERPSGEIVGLEVKASATVRAGDFAGLRHLRERVGERMVGGAILYAGAHTLPFGKRTWALPLEALWASD